MKHGLLLCLLCCFMTGSYAQKSRIIARSGYNYNGSRFFLIDSTNYTYYYPYLGGDLNSRYIAYSDAITYQYDTLKGIAERVNKSLQYFDAANHLTTTTNYHWKSTWLETDQVLYTSTIDDSILTKTEQTWNSATHAWENAAKKEYTYDPHGNTTSFALYTWETTTGTWLGNERFLYSYNGFNSLVNQVYQNWDAGTADWRNILRDSFAYNAGKQKTVVINYVWDYTGAVWNNNQKTGYNYDSKSFLVLELIQSWDNTSGLWVDNQRFLFTNDASGDVLQQAIQNWNNTGHTWDNFRNHLFTYDTRADVLTDIWQNWNKSTTMYVNSQQLAHTFDAHDNMLTETAYVWDNTGSRWEENELDSFAYNAFDQLTYSTYYTGWDKILSSWLHRAEDQEFYYYYQPYTSSVAEPEFRSYTLQLYPVPAAALLTIGFKTVQEENWFGRIRNMSGTVCRQWTIGQSADYRETISISGLSAGTYSLEFVSNNGHLVQKTFTVLH